MQVASWLNDRRQPPKESLYFIQYVYQGCKIADEFVLTVGSFVVATAHKDQVQCTLYAHTQGHVARCRRKLNMISKLTTPCK